MFAPMASTCRVRIVRTGHEKFGPSLQLATQDGSWLGLHLASEPEVSPVRCCLEGHVLQQMGGS